MSQHREKVVSCPHCKHSARYEVAVSLQEPVGSPVRQEVLTDRFHQFRCRACGREFSYDGPFIWTDFEAKRWIGVYPAAWEKDWRALEAEPQGSWQRAMVDFAPPVVQRTAEGYQVRAVFGLQALREKVCCYEAGIDDRHLEVFKLELMRTTPEMGVAPSRRPRLWLVDGEKLVFTVTVEENGKPIDLEFSVPREDLRHIERDCGPWEAALTAISGGPYVDVGRIMIVPLPV